MADKIDQLKIGSTSYDIDLPPDATPSINSLTTANYIKTYGGFELVDDVDNNVRVVGGLFTGLGATGDEIIYSDSSYAYTSLFADSNYTLIYSTAEDYTEDFTFTTKTLRISDDADTGYWIQVSAEEKLIEWSDGTVNYTWAFPNNSGMVALTSDICNSSIAYCSTAASTAAKTATMPNFTNLISGTRILLRTTNTNTVSSNVTLNVNNTGAKPVTKMGVPVSNTNFYAGDYIAWYNGTSWDITNIYINEPNYYPIRTYSSGLNISGYYGSTSCQLYVPYATTDQKGVVEIMDNDQMDAQTGGTSPTAAVNPIVDLVYPVGAVYVSTTDSTVAAVQARFIGTTWVKIKDRFLLADGDYYNAGDTGGESSHTLTIDEIPSHSHAIRFNGNSTVDVAGDNSAGSGGTWKGVATGQGWNNLTLTSAGGGQSHNNMPPYYVVHMYRRTA